MQLLNTASILASFLTIYFFHKMLTYDNTIKKMVFICLFLFLIGVTENNSDCAKTAPFLMKVIVFQILCIGFVISIKGYLKIYLVKRQILCQNCEWRYMYTFVILILMLTSIIGLLYSIVVQYYLQLLQKQLFIMLTSVVMGFVIIGVGDYAYILINKGKSLSDSLRRKIFHFVPVILLPILVQINYKVFTLMALGSYYLFWLVQVIRYFGAISRKQCTHITQNKINHNQQANCISQVSASFSFAPSYLINKATCQLYKINKILSEVSFIKWMQQLNSTRQPYFWFTHFSLILGLIMTYIYYSQIPSHNNKLKYSGGELKVKQNISIILAIADAMAAIIGRKLGSTRTRIPFTNKKTIPGYLGYFLTAFSLQLILYLLLCLYNNSHIPNIVENDFVKFIAFSSFLCGIGELFSGDLDNIVCGFVYILSDYFWNFGTIA